MGAPIVRCCEGCGAAFSVRFPSVPKRFCGRGCAVRTAARTRILGRNANWRGGTTKHPLYDTYMDMIGRCERPTHHAYARYGGRGITVCPRWRSDFWAFVADVGERPPGHSIDRVDNDGPYASDNFRWATSSEQNRNRRSAAYAGSRRDAVSGQFLPGGSA